MTELLDDIARCTGSDITGTWTCPERETCARFLQLYKHSGRSNRISVFFGAPGCNNKIEAAAKED